MPIQAASPLVNSRIVLFNGAVYCGFSGRRDVRNTAHKAGEEVRESVCECQSAFSRLRFEDRAFVGLFVEP